MLKGMQMGLDWGLEKGTGTPLKLSVSLLPSVAVVLPYTPWVWVLAFSEQPGNTSVRESVHLPQS